MQKDFLSDSENEENFSINLDSNHASSSCGKNKKKKKKRLNERDINK